MLSLNIMWLSTEAARSVVWWDTTATVQEIMNAVIVLYVQFIQCDLPILLKQSNYLFLRLFYYLFFHGLANLLVPRPHESTVSWLCKSTASMTLWINCFHGLENQPLPWLCESTVSMALRINCFHGFANQLFQEFANQLRSRLRKSTDSMASRINCFHGIANQLFPWLRKSTPSMALGINFFHGFAK